MRSKSQEKRGRKKVTPTYRIENVYNPEAMPQYFQISVNILEGKKFVWSNSYSANSYVIAVLGKKKHRTNIRRNIQEPCYRENFVFELYTTLQELQQLTLWLAVMEPKCCAPPRLLGEANVDLGAVWAQPHHQVFHKWAQLCLPRDLSAGPVGFLQIDVSIIFRGEVQVTPSVIRDDNLENNLLLPSNCEQQCANYLITIYGAFGLPNGSQPTGDKRFGKAPSTFVRISFCGLVAKTDVVHRSSNPMYCEQISLVEMFPNMSQFIRFEICSAEGCFNRVWACVYLKLAQISHDGENGFLPTFGPSLLHIYGMSYTGTLGVNADDGPYHRGSLLVALKTIVPFYQHPIRSINVEPATQVKMDNLWLLEDFCVYCPIFEVSMLDSKVAGRYCGVAITIGEIPCDTKSGEEFQDSMNEIRSRKMHYTGSLEVLKNQSVYGYLDFYNLFPVLQYATRLPDFRFRMYANNMIYGIITNLDISLSKVERKLRDVSYSSPNELKDEINKVLDDVAGNIMKFLDIVQYSTPSINSYENILRHNSTELDRKQLALQKEEIEKIYQQTMNKFKYNSSPSLVPSIGEETRNAVSKKNIKSLLADAQNLAQNLKNLVFKNLEGWPDLVLWLLNGGSRVAYTKISPADIIYSVIPEQNGKYCGQIQTLYLKPIKCPKHLSTQAATCHCITAKVELLTWMGLYRQKPAFESNLFGGYKLKVKDYEMSLKSSAMMVEYRAFIYKAKLTSHCNELNSLQLFIRINALSSVKETKVKCKTLTPIWNQVLKMHRMVFMTPERLAISPPIVLVELNNTDLSGKTDLFGRFQVQPVVDEESDYQYAPRLQWYSLYRGDECSGQVLMSVQLLQIPEMVLKTTIYSPVEESFVANGQKDFDVVDNIEPLPNNLLPVSTCYKVDIYWWGLRDLNITRKPSVILEIEDLSIKSEVIANRRSNCNFPNGRISQLLEAPLNEAYCPPLNIKLYDSSTFGRILYLGTNVVKNPNKYMVNWLPKVERDASLKRASIMSSDFVQVNQMLFIKKNSHSIKESINYGSKIDTNKSTDKCMVKCKKWRKLFWRRQPDEEEYTLLPIFAAKRPKTLIDSQTGEGDSVWWLKYLRSHKDYNEEDGVSPVGKLVIYDSELESQPEFSKFRDWCATLKLYNGKTTDILSKDQLHYCGLLKAGIAIYKWPPPTDTIAVADSGVELDKGFFDDRPSNDPTKYLVRTYIVKGFNLKIKEFSSKSDPYIVLSCGKKLLGDRNDYVSNTFNPIFGRMYEFRCNLPEDYRLTVSLYNYEASLPDELIGCTDIDLENRIYTKHRARVGLPFEYRLNEPLIWRDCVKPSAILEELCIKNHLPAPVFSNSTLIINGVEYKDNERDKALLLNVEQKENLCLSILHKWNTLPICGYHLVPEHVETRILTHPDKPGVEQGKLHMWIDIFPLENGVHIPPAINMAPRKVEDYELRLIVYTVRALNLRKDQCERGISDFYVRAWLGSTEQVQRTDVHYRCITGESNFNWRMIFNFQYQPFIRKLVHKEVGVFTEYEENINPVLIVELMDNESTCTDDNLGSLLLNLNAIPQGAKYIDRCTLNIMNNYKKINLFSVKTLRAWWPLIAVDECCSSLLGKIDLEMTLLPKESANKVPVGLGREPPYPLPEPVRVENIPLQCCSVKGIKDFCGTQCFWITVAIFVILALTWYFQIPMLLEYWLWI